MLTGRFGPVYMGMPLDELKQVLGEPSESYDSGAGTALLFYKGFEFYYFTDDNTLYGIQNDNVSYEIPDVIENRFRFNDDLEIDTWFIHFGKALTYEQVLIFLDHEQVGFEKHDKPDHDEITLPGGVSFDFENYKDEQGNMKFERTKAKLIGIRYFVF